DEKAARVAADVECGAGGADALLHLLAGCSVDAAERAEHAPIDQAEDAHGATSSSSLCGSSWKRVATTGPAAATVRSTRTKRAMYAALNRYFGPSASQMRRMSSRLKLAGISWALSVASHPAALARIEPSKTGFDSSCSMTQLRIVCSASALLPQYVIR